MVFRTMYASCYSRNSVLCTSLCIPFSKRLTRGATDSHFGTAQVRCFDGVKDMALPGVDCFVI